MINDTSLLPEAFSALDTHIEKGLDTIEQRGKSGVSFLFDHLSVWQKHSRLRTRLVGGTTHLVRLASAALFGVSRGYHVEVQSD